MNQTLLDCTVWTLVLAATGLLFATAGTTDAMRARLKRNLRAWRAGR